MKIKNACTFYIVRHGETEWNVQGILQGHADSPLTQKGLKQAKTVATELKSIHFDAAFSSDSLRAHRTAKIIALEHKIAVKTTELLREKNFGKWEGHPYSVFSNELKDMLEEFDSLSNEDKMAYKHPDIESDEEAVTRFITFLRETAVAYPDQTVLVATHGGMMRTLLIHLGFGRYDQLQPDAVKNSAYIKLESDGIEFSVKETKNIKRVE